MVHFNFCDTSSRLFFFLSILASKNTAKKQAGPWSMGWLALMDLLERLDQFYSRAINRALILPHVVFRTMRCKT